MKSVKAHEDSRGGEGGEISEGSEGRDGNNSDDVNVDYVRSEGV